MTWKLKQINCQSPITLGRKKRVFHLLNVRRRDNESTLPFIISASGVDESQFGTLLKALSNVSRLQNEVILGQEIPFSDMSQRSEKLLLHVYCDKHCHYKEREQAVIS